jgi:hypothetical protein
VSRKLALTGEAPRHKVMVMFSNIPEKGGSMGKSTVRKSLKRRNLMSIFPEETFSRESTLLLVLSPCGTLPVGVGFRAAANPKMEKSGRTASRRREGARPLPQTSPGVGHAHCERGDLSPSACPQRGGVFLPCHCVGSEGAGAHPLRRRWGWHGTCSPQGAMAPHTTSAPEGGVHAKGITSRDRTTSPRHLF